jgi:hypothetical protein
MPVSRSGRHSRQHGWSFSTLPGTSRECDPASNTPGNRLFDDVPVEKADKQPPLRGNCRPLGLTKLPVPPKCPKPPGWRKVPLAGNFLPKSRQGFRPKMPSFGHSAATPRRRGFLGCGNWRPALRRHRHAGDFQLDRAERASCRDVERRPSGRDIEGGDQPFGRESLT